LRSRVNMKIPLWLKRRIQRDPEQTLSPREMTGLGIGLCYLVVICFLAFRYLEVWIAPAPKDKALHRKCVLIASDIAEGSDSAYNASYDLCVKGELK
jgi:hypothetical protein